MSDMQDEADRAALEEQLSLPQVLSGQFSNFSLVNIFDQSESIFLTNQNQLFENFFYRKIY